MDEWLKRDENSFGNIQPVPKAALQINCKKASRRQVKPCLKDPTELSIVAVSNEKNIPQVFQIWLSNILQ